MSTNISEASSSIFASTSGQYTLNLKSIQLARRYSLYVGPHDTLADVETFLHSQPQLHEELASRAPLLFREEQASLPLPHHLRVHQLAGDSPREFDLFVEVQVERRKGDVCCKCELF